jgi:formate dehydrogenase major subunit
MTGADPTALKTDGENHFEPDGRHPFIIKDQNKCILCGSCVRACDELRHVGAWGFVERGYITTVQPSFGKPLQETECEACGTCVQVCPTGSLDEKFSDAKPVPENYTNMPGGCTFCGFGCRLDLGHVDGRLVAVTGAPWGHNKGLLCKYGRYGTHYINNLKRIEAPMKRVNGQLVHIAWDEAMNILEEKTKNIPGKDWMVFAGGRLTLEELAQLSIFADNKIPGAKLGSFAYDSIMGGKIIAETYSTDGPPWSYSEIDGAELIFTIGLREMDLMTVLGVKIRDAKAKGATLIGLNRQEQKKLHHIFDHYICTDSCAAFLASLFKEISINSTIEGCKHVHEILDKQKLPSPDSNFVSLLGARKKIVIVVSGHAGQSAIQWAANISAILNVPILNLPTKINAQGIIETGFTCSPSEKRALLITAEDPVGCAVDHTWVSEIINKAEFIAVADAFLTPTCEKANLLLPIKVSGERKGTFLSGERRIVRLIQALKANFVSFFDKLPEAVPPQRFKGVPGEERLKTTVKERIIRVADISDSPIKISNGGDFLDLTVSQEFERLGI